MLTFIFICIHERNRLARADKTRMPIGSVGKETTAGSVLVGSEFVKLARQRPPDGIPTAPMRST